MDILSENTSHAKTEIQKHMFGSYMATSNPGGVKGIHSPCGRCFQKMLLAQPGLGATGYRFVRKR